MASPTITIAIPPKIRLAFKLAAMKQNKTMTEVIVAFIKQFIEEAEKKKIDE